ncbi:AIPR family protein [Corynebacterium sp. UMB10321]|uniref:AIPR family protein n=1 Tax=Corynebacterium sp. UMB10321 TaxID=3046312 RepID=UPI00254BFFFC|nr:AIPR family protein [Corynebacterium sp. UMB10321]MDK8245011.1 AIPR family protein [Corynebacterium sp. UMB10321]
MQNDNTDRTIVIKMAHRNMADIGPLNRITGLINIANCIDLITQEDLTANPRRPKRTAITQDIVETLLTSPEMMPFYSKGLLIGCSNVLERERNRYQLHFADPEREGVLDGGHNLMAIALTVLMAIGVPESQLRKIKFWDQLKECWTEHAKEIETLKREKHDPLLEVLVPVEIVAPRTEDADGDVITEFNNLILQICANRNQNAQLAADAIANQSGVFDFLKASLPEELVDDVTWSTNDNKRIDPRMLVSLTWVAMSKVPTLDDYDVAALPATTAYSSKAESLSRFTKLMQAKGAAEQTSDGKSYVVLDPYIASAFDMMPEILQCYDLMYKGYKEAYNATGGSFGRILAVKKTSKRVNYTPFSNEPVNHEVPPAGFLLPVVFALQALIKVDSENEQLIWMINPVEFFSDMNNLQEIIRALKPIIEMTNWNPQIVGKNAASYNATYDKARNMVLETLLG